MNSDEIRKSLEAKLAQLARRIRQIESELRTPGSADSGERAVEFENQEVLERLDTAEREEIDLIRRAIGRIDAGTYSVCERCNGTIGPARLSALPYTDVCVKCAD
jgi:RNA polymerase-binding transcription factor DksA